MADDFGRYHLLARLGQGGMGEVWHARVRADDGDDRDVVVKRMLSHLSGDNELVRSFAREARLCGMLDHPNIVRVFEFGNVGGEHYLAMEHVPGINLLQVLRARRAGGIEAGAAAFIIAAVCRALAYAYNAIDDDGAPLHLVHRDVTPSNIMIARDGEVKLLDFGIAKALAEVTDSHTSTGTLKGKFGYMAPEIVEGGRADHRSDQFSAGVMLHELLTGQRLFRGETDLQTIAKVREAIVVAPSHSNRAIEPALDEIVLRALARNPTVRFPDCASMAEALEAIAAGAGWGRERNAALVRELSPAATQDIVSLGVGDVTSRETRRKAGAPSSQKPRRWPVLVVAAAVVAAGGAYAALRSSPAPIAPPPPEPTHAATAPVAVPPAPHDVAPIAPPPPEPMERPAPHATLRAHPRPGKSEKKEAAKEAPRAQPPHSNVGQVRAGKLLDPFSR